MNLRECARLIMEAAIAAVDPYRAVTEALAHLPKEAWAGKRVIVIGAGKAAARMAEAVEAGLGESIRAGWVNTKYGHSDRRGGRIDCHECGHPVPDAAGVAGAERIAELARSATAEDVVLCLISGGASALMPLPVEGVTLAEKQETTRLLLGSGASIHEINAVRKHLSRIKGGRLAQLAAPARVWTLILSDVVGDDLDVIGSGPTVPDASTFAGARRVLAQRGIWEHVPRAVRRHIEAPREETPKPGDPVFAGVTNRLIATNRVALEAARAKARELGFGTLLLSARVEGEAREVARVHAAILREAATTGDPIPRPACLLSGGETTVTLRSGSKGGHGKGGRNQEFALAAALDLAEVPGVLLLSAGTDGTDGPTDAAGAFADGTTVERARRAGFDTSRALAENDAYPLFAAIGDLYVTGPTGTNVMDICLMLTASGPADSV